MGLFGRFKRLKHSAASEPVGKKPSRLGSSFSSGLTGARDRVQGFAQLVKAKFPKNLEDLRRLQSDEALERARELFSSRAYGTYLRFGAAAFAAYFLADTVSLFTASLIPEPPTVPPVRVARRDEKRSSLNEYDAILTRNIFNSRGIIPEDDANVASGPARKSNLPLNLVGTVVLQDELKSIAAIEDKSQNMVFPVRVEDTIADKIKVTKIEHLRVYFINKSSGHLEYIEIVEDVPMLETQARRPTGPAKGNSGSGITQSGETNFEVERTAIDRAMSNFGEVLTQARAIPNFENGIPDGYKLLQIVPGSIYEQLGLKNGDVVTGVNGEPMTDPAKAMQLFNQLRELNRVELQVKRGGRKMTLDFNIRG